MTLYDSSVLIDYLDGNPATAQYVEDHHDERAVTIPLVVFECYHGEIFKTGQADFDALDRALTWLTVVDETADVARAAAELQDELQGGGQTLTARDAFIAGAAIDLDESLAVSDSDFDVEGITDRLPVDFL